MKDSARFLRERAELDRLEGEVDWLVFTWRIDSVGVIEVDFDLVVHGRTFAARMTYPNVFPNSPPYIRPRDSSERWTAHQYGDGGSLCLEWRADNWHPHVTGADIIQSAFDLLSAEQHPAHPAVVPSAHYVTEGQSMRSNNYRFVVTDGLLHALNVLPQNSSAILTTHTVFNLSATVVFVSEISTDDSAGQKISDLPLAMYTYTTLLALKGEGWVFKSDAFDNAATISSTDDLLRMLSESDLQLDCLVVKEEGASKFKGGVVVLIGAGLMLPRVFKIEFSEQVLREYRVIMPSSSTARLPEECEQLSTVRVGIVGMGSIGSKVALSLARSGVRKFLLLDDDYLMPGNLVRHELSWAFVGVHKVNAVHDALGLVAAGMDVAVRTHRLAGQESGLSAAAALKDLANCDLLIDATANPEVFLRMAAIAKANKKSLCWGELFASGYGGLIARARPDLDPSPLAVRSSIHAYFSTLPSAPFQQAGGYDVEQEQPLIAYDADVGQIATSLTRFVIDTVLQRNPSQFPYSAYLIGLRQEWVFGQPFDTRPINVEGEGWDEPAKSGEGDSEAISVLLKLFEDRQRDQTDSPS